MTGPGQVRPSEVRVDLDAVRHNVAHLGRVAGTDVCAVVKADGYGHGAVPVARAALAGGATWLAVALVEEARVLRAAGVDAPLLLLSEPPDSAVDAVLDADLTPIVYRPAFVAALDAAAGRRGRTVAVHAKVDTGMGRVGAPAADWPALLHALRDADHLAVDGVLTHLARADEPAADTTDQQLAAFADALAVAAELGMRPRWVHAANTAGTLLFPLPGTAWSDPASASTGCRPTSTSTPPTTGCAPPCRWSAP